MRHGGQGWLDYDCLFWQQAALNPSLPWNVVHPGLQATTIQGTRSSGTFCNLCQECDHVAAQCALTQLQQQSVRGSDNGGRGVVASVPHGTMVHVLSRGLAIIATQVG